MNLKQLTRPFKSTNFREPATLLLGLIGNADQVTFTAGGETYTLTSTAASKAAGFNVKRLGQDPQALAKHLRTTAG